MASLAVCGEKSRKYNNKTSLDTNDIMKYSLYNGKSGLNYPYTAIWCLRPYFPRTFRGITLVIFGVER